MDQEASYDKAGSFSIDRLCFLVPAVIKSGKTFFLNEGKNNKATFPTVSTGKSSGYYFISNSEQS